MRERKSFFWWRRRRDAEKVLRFLGRVICFLRGAHFAYNDFGGGWDAVKCHICDRTKVLRYYGYEKPDTEYLNPYWS